MGEGEGEGLGVAFGAGVGVGDGLEVVVVECAGGVVGVEFDPVDDEPVDEEPVDEVGVGVGVGAALGVGVLVEAVAWLGELVAAPVELTTWPLEPPLEPPPPQAVKVTSDAIATKALKRGCMLCVPP